MAIDQIRSFNRFYTRKIGLISNRFLDSEFSLIQARLLFEFSCTHPLYASDLSRKLGLSPDSLSKIISRFETQGLVDRTPSPQDSRKQALALTPDGIAAYARLKESANARIEEMIDGLTRDQIHRLVAAMDTIRETLEPDQSNLNLVTLRSHRPGDIGMVIHRHGVLYAREYGFNHEFDAYVADGMARFIQTLSPREHLWIAEIGGQFCGSVAAVRRDDQTAQLRWLIVEPGERKKGIGKQLVQEVIRFCRENDYQAIMLWTIDFLHAARHLYDQVGFRRVETQQSQVWGQALTEECWQLRLNGSD
jgi:DNA-binding MarR family transcriptional regulator/GNAT superfamily N-acetyltransferase